MTPWTRYRGSFGPEQAAHLLRRAGFGGSHEDLVRSAERGLDATVDALFGEECGVDAERALDAARRLAPLNEVRTVRSLWLVAMQESLCAGREKLALFWHGHFATSVEKVASTELMWAQIQLLRDKATAPFEELVLAVARDPAMILWLDGNSNRKGQPNENFARELMELFTLGVGPYDEHDVQEAARAFSGWHVQQGSFRFQARAHDDGIKEVLGERGALGGEDVVRLCVRHPASARFLAGKLLRAYACAEPPAARIEAFAEEIRRQEGRIADALGVLLRSDWFYSEEVRGRCILGPVEFTLPRLRALSARGRPAALADTLTEMGQSLLAPPNVSGWEGGRSWINSHTLLVRARFARELCTGEGRLGARVDWDEVLGGRVGEEALDHLALLLLGGPLSGETREVLMDTWGAEVGAPSVAECAAAMLALPEAQLG